MLHACNTGRPSSLIVGDNIPLCGDSRSLCPVLSSSILYIPPVYCMMSSIHCLQVSMVPSALYSGFQQSVTSTCPKYSSFNNATSATIWKIHYWLLVQWYDIPSSFSPAPHFKCFYSVQHHIWNCLTMTFIISICNIMLPVIFLSF